LFTVRAFQYNDCARPAPSVSVQRTKSRSASCRQLMRHGSGIPSFGWFSSHISVNPEDLAETITMEPEVTLSLELMSSAESCCHLGHLAHHTGTSRLVPYSRRRFRQWTTAFSSLSARLPRCKNSGASGSSCLPATWRCNLEPLQFCELTLGRARPATRFECDDLRTNAATSDSGTSRSIVLANYW